MEGEKRRKVKVKEKREGEEGGGERVEDKWMTE